MLYICTKFREIIGIEVIERTRFLYGKLQRGIIMQKCSWSDHSLISACRLVMFYISTKFCEITSNGIKVMERKLFYTEKYKGELLCKNVGGVTVVYLCTLSGHALYFYQVCKIILNGIKVIEPIQFHY